MRKLLALVVAMLVALPISSWAAATQVDALIEKLVDKGILDKAEARALKMEIASDAKAIQEDTAQSVIPDWVKNTKLKGDVRVRYQYERKKDSSEARSRGRVRYRLGLENKINDQWKVGAGLASAAVDKNSASTVDDPRSTNMTFEDSFSRGTVRLDYAFAEFQPVAWGKLVGGKFIKSDYLWTPTDMLWDGDINPAGGSVHMEHKFGDVLSGYLNSGVWVIDENSTADRPDPFLNYAQAGVNYKQGDIGLKLAGVYYGFNGVKGVSLDSNQSSNTYVTGTTLQYDYDSVGGSAEFSIKNPTAGVLPVGMLALFGDVIKNIDSAVNDGTGWAAGAKIGDEKVNGAKQWQLKYQYTRLGKDAWPDAFPDSDRYGGAADVKGNEWELTLGLSKNVSLGFDYYQDQRMKASNNQQRLIQADLNVKF